MLIFYSVLHKEKNDNGVMFVIMFVDVGIISKSSGTLNHRYFKDNTNMASISHVTYTSKAGLGGKFKHITPASLFCNVLF